MVFDDPWADPIAVLVAEEDETPVGFVCAVTRRGEAEEGKPTVYIKALCFDSAVPDAAAFLVESVLSAARLVGAARVRFGRYRGVSYFIPGVDVRYERLVRFFEDGKWEMIEELADAVVDLVAWKPGDEVRAKLRAAEDRGVGVYRYEPEMLEKMRQFISDKGFPEYFRHFFREGWDVDWLVPRNAVVAMLKGEIVGYGEFRPNSMGGEFGPAAVLEEFREQGIGTAILLKAMTIMKDGGTPRATASWVWPREYYIRNGWRISRRYNVYEKNMERE